MTSVHTVLVIGGYGFFGSRIAEALTRNPQVRVLVGGRDAAKGREAAQNLGLPPESGIGVDTAGGNLAETLRTIGVNTVIHTAGPFQGQGYSVATAAIQAGSNYVDLADGRAFVSGISSLDRAAKERGVTVISGASSVPALSSAVVDHYLPAFGRLDAIRAGIGSGARAPGLATVKGIFGYCGKPIRRLEKGVWVETHGWLDLKRYRFPGPVGARWLGSSDVPDLELFPMRYAVNTVTFHVGFASDLGHLAVWALAGLVKAGVMSSMAPLARPLNRMSRWLEPIVSDKGAMFVELEGFGHEGNPLVKRWYLLVSQNHGPYVPCGASIALVNKLASGEALPKGAMPCMGLLTVEEYLAPLEGLDIKVIADQI